VRAARRVSPGSAGLAVQEGRLALLAGDRGAALAAFDRADELARGDASQRRYIAATLRSAGLDAEAGRWESISTAPPSDRP
ncbi:MAG TPA: hypothetical protein DEB06_07965, partial [Phycisphaerales bacterium]|nr:hypothetical protein [Phycisphaerales bacterium]